MLTQLLLASAVAAGTWVTYAKSYMDSDGKDRVYQVEAQSIVRRGDKVFANGRIRFASGSTWQPKAIWSLTADCKRKTFTEALETEVGIPLQFRENYWWYDSELKSGIRGKIYDGQSQESIDMSRDIGQRRSARLTKAWEFLCQKGVNSWW